MSELRDASQIVQEDLLPRMNALCERARSLDEPAQEAFFERILRSLESARQVEDLADPFMALSTAAFQGFLFAPDVALVLDEVLAISQSIAMTMTASDEAAQ